MDVWQLNLHRILKSFTIDRLIFGFVLIFLSFTANSAEFYNLKYQTNNNLLIPSDVNQCALTFVLPDGQELDYLMERNEYQYVNINLELPYINGQNYILKVKKDWLLFHKRCNLFDEISLNELIFNQWMIEYPDSKFRNCIDVGLEIVGDGGVVSYGNGYTNERKKVLPHVEDSVSQKIIGACHVVTTIKLEDNIECTWSNGTKKSICDQDYANSNDLSKRLSFKEAVNSALNGNKIVAGLWESNAGKSQRLAIESKVKEQQEKEEERRKWLDTSEGKKYLAAENAKNKILEEQQKLLEPPSGMFMCFQEVTEDLVTGRKSPGIDSSNGFIVKLLGQKGIMAIPDAPYANGPWVFSHYQAIIDGNKILHKYHINDKFFKEINISVVNGRVNSWEQRASRYSIRGACRSAK